MGPVSVTRQGTVAAGEASRRLAACRAGRLRAGGRGLRRREGEARAHGIGAAEGVEDRGHADDLAHGGRVFKGPSPENGPTGIKPEAPAIARPPQRVGIWWGRA